jgi:CDP-paratose 2-epimerase
MKRYLITGGCGFLGSNIAARLISGDAEVALFDNLSRRGSVANLEWLQSLGKVNFLHGDIRSNGDISSVIQRISPDVIFHLAGQVAMTTSLSNPRLDFEVNTIGTFNLLEAVHQ